jgi:hypothetical protein
VWIMDRISTEVEADPDYRDAIEAVQDEGLASPSDIIAGTTNPLRIECLTSTNRLLANLRKIDSHGVSKFSRQTTRHHLSRLPNLPQLLVLSVIRWYSHLQRQIQPHAIFGVGEADTTEVLNATYPVIHRIAMDAQCRGGAGRLHVVSEPGFQGPEQLASAVMFQQQPQRPSQFLGLPSLPEAIQQDRQHQIGIIERNRLRAPLLADAQGGPGNPVRPSQPAHVRKIMPQGQTYSERAGLPHARYQILGPLPMPIRVPLPPLIQCGLEHHQFIEGYGGD